MSVSFRPGSAMPGRRLALTRSAAALTGVVFLVLAGGAALAAPSPFGVGLPETTMQTGGPFAGFFAWVSAQQTAFYGALTSALKEMKADGTAGLWLMGLSFAYGVFHAAGPGHGKAVISSYVVANGETLRRGVVLSFVSAMAQAVTAILLIGVAAVILRMTSIAITETTRWFELGSYLAVTLLGVALVWRKIVRPLFPERRPRALGAQVACSPLDTVFSASAPAIRPWRCRQPLLPASVQLRALPVSGCAIGRLPRPRSTSVPIADARMRPWRRRSRGPCRSRAPGR